MGARLGKRRRPGPAPRCEACRFRTATRTPSGRPRPAVARAAKWAPRRCGRSPQSPPRHRAWRSRAQAAVHRERRARRQPLEYVEVRVLFSVAYLGTRGRDDTTEPSSGGVRAERRRGPAGRARDGVGDRALRGHRRGGAAVERRGGDAPRPAQRRTAPVDDGRTRPRPIAETGVEARASAAGHSAGRRPRHRCGTRWSRRSRWPT